jgi:hypothetical protein
MLAYAHVFVMSRVTPTDPYKRYTDPTGEFSNRSLEIGTWYLTHKTILERIGFALLALTAATLITVAVGMWSAYLIVGISTDNRMAAEETRLFQNYEQIRSGSAAVPLTVQGLQVYVSAPDTYDMVAMVQNPNKDWIAHLSYHFIYSTGTTTVHEAILMPGANQPVAVLGASLSSYPLSVQLTLDAVSFERINPHAVPDIRGFIASHVAFTTDHFVFTHAQPGQNNLPVHDIRFSLTNTSAYSYWEPAFYAELMNGGQSVGILYITLDSFRSGETRTIDIRSSAPDLLADSITLYPLVNPFDESSIMPPTP